MLSTLAISESEKILIVAPHPDDECIGCGGLLLLYPNQCDIIVLTDGRQGQGDLPQHKMIEIRKSELKNEMDIVNPHMFKNLNLEDGTMAKHLYALYDIDFSIYSKIFVTSENDGHIDHTMAFHCVMKALNNQNIRNTVVYLYEVHNPLNNPEFFLDITNIIGKKQDLIRCHASQICKMPYHEMVLYLAKFRAFQNHMCDKYIEVYEKVDLIGNQKDCLDLKENIEMQKQRQFYWVLTRWMELQMNGKSCLDTLIQNNFKNIAVYGIAELGKLLIKEISNNNGVNLLYVLDKKAIEYEGNLVLKPDAIMSSNIRRPDCVIVTAVFYFDEIEKELIELGYTNIISLKDLVVDENSVL